MSQSRKPPPLMFIVGDVKNPYRTTKAIKSAKTSHISSRYRCWNKANHQDLALDSTTKAILTGGTTSTSSSGLQRSSSSPADNPKTPSVGRAPTTDDDETEQQQDHKDANQILEADASTDDGENGALLPVAATNCLTTTSQKPRVAIKPWEHDLRAYEEWTASPLRLLGTQFFDIFTPSTAITYDTEIKANLYFYFWVIKPFATHLLQSWKWLDNLSQIQASPCLTYAVATYASVFLSGMLRGGPGVVLPPPTERGQTSHWPIPAWLRLHTRCLAELNAFLSDPSQAVDDSCYQAILFLYRLSVLLADGESGRMHLQALKRMSLLLDMNEASLETELAVSKINIIGAFLHSRSIVVVRKAHRRKQECRKEMIEIDRKFWKSDREWYSHRAHLAGRMLAWRPESPSSSILPESATAIARMDPDSRRFLGESEHLEMQRCYQIALFFWMYLNCISFNTSALIVRSNLLELQYRLSNMDLPTMSSICHTTLFNILLAGMVASRNQPERWWFVEQIVWLYPTIQHLDTVWQLLAEFFDSLSINFRFIQEIWEDIAAARRTLVKSTSPTDGQLVNPIMHFRPTSYSPDLTRPLPVLELEDTEGVSLEKSIHRSPGRASVAS
ncbi:uncharacterized protein Z520_04881 [Fonsecaea multimorphosa CBS 102226]|uniref:Transcription factor domain-containing protein n=1 Tax=Fonsecaea multimorphosa CBS 102226 TaxID=1442371 RepID=A0A0D2HBN7_9EURO|nr:uncharacterized protein Z520_04881 [Fonsecaea multimorphosa CBS 102226]KIX99305.1 hypothetical protein Z520_04881 [Fonsecaea multimorphosa CBS 102226]OAL25831.1 hypothetical protein AYO22_04625 [Fonsecaea multimorphosa]